jgi:putative endonuclease
MHYAYVLKSIKKAFYYTGCCKDLKIRFKQHNNKEVQSTKSYAPFIIVYYEACLNENDAYSREKYLKSRLGKKYLKNRLKYWFEENKE